MILQERKKDIWARSTVLANHLGGRLPDVAITGLLDEASVQSFTASWKG